jgi:hypothetical protein
MSAAIVAQPSGTQRDTGKGNQFMANRIGQSLWRWSDGGRLPIVCDTSSCSFGMTSEIVEYLTPENRERHGKLKIFDSVAWAHDRLLPKLPVRRTATSAVVHPSCSINHLNLAKKLHALAAALAEEAVTPVAAIVASCTPSSPGQRLPRKQRKSAHASSTPIWAATAPVRLA